MQVETSPAPRTPLNISVDYRRSYARGESKGVLKNLSITGAFLAQKGESLRPGEKINLTFSVSNRERNIQATVIWTNSLGSGVKFSPQNNRDTQIIDDLLYFIESKRTDTRDILQMIFQKVI